MNITPTDRNCCATPQLSPEDLQCIYEMYLLYMQLHHTDEALNTSVNDETE